MDNLTLGNIDKPTLRNLIDAALCKKSFYHFVKYFWQIEHDFPMIESWYVKAICDHLQALYEDKIDNLLLNVPPGFGKSLIVSAMFPAWVWAKNPKASFLCASCNHDVANRDARRQKDIVKNPLFRSMFGIEWEIDKDQDAKELFRNTAGGFRQSKTPGQAIQGARVTYCLTDDLIDASAAFADKPAMEEANQWRDLVFSTRKTLGIRGKEIHIQQRLHARDITGHLTEREPDKWTVVKIPLEYDPSIVSFINSPLKWEDPRTEPGELLCVELFDAEKREETLTQLQEYGFACQYQQSPLSEQGNLMKREWFGHWEDETIPDTFDSMYVSCDLNNLKAKKHTKDTDYSVIDLWGTHGEDYYLIEQIRKRSTIKESYEDIDALVQEYRTRGLTAVLIEKAANGPSVIEHLSLAYGGLIQAISVQGESKSQRVKACGPVLSTGHVFLPNISYQPWVFDWLKEITGFPGARRDDRVDCMSQVILYHSLNKKSPAKVYSFAERLRQKKAGLV